MILSVVIVYNSFSRMEPRKAYILSCTKALLDLPEEPQSLATSKILDSYIADRTEGTLILSYHPRNGFKNLKGGNSAESGSQLLHITKGANFKDCDNPSQCLSISLRPDDLMKYLLKSLKCLYNPLVRKTEPELLENFDNLRASLESISVRKLKDENDLDIQKIQEEFDFWRDQALASADAKAKYINEQYTKIDKSWAIRGFDLINLKDSIDALWTCLGSIWDSDHSYSEKRLQKIVQLFGEEISQRVTEDLSSDQLWSLEKEEKIKILEAIECCKKFIRLCELNQSQLLKKKVSPFNTKVVEELQTKLVTLTRIKASVEELMRVEDGNSLVKL